MPERFDLVVIQYNNGCKGFAYAPVITGNVHVGDRVITAFGEGNVIASVTWCSPEDDYFKVISDMYTIDKVTHKVVPVIYEKEVEEE